MDAFDTNCYVVWPTAPGADPTPSPGTPCIVIDAGFGVDSLIQFVRGSGLVPSLLALSHAHVDHIAGVAQLRLEFRGLPVALHESEQTWLDDPMLNLSAMMGEPVRLKGPDRVLREGDSVLVGDATSAAALRVLHTPGHSPGGVAFVCDAAGTAFVGDTLFAGSIGRHDFPGSSFRELEQSIRTKLYTLPPATIVLPGHGPATTVDRERHSNPFVRAVQPPQ